MALTQCYTFPRSKDGESINVFPMTTTSIPNSVSRGFLSFGGWTAVKAALVGSIIAVFVTLASSAAYDIWRNGWSGSAFGSNGFEGFVLYSGLVLVSSVFLWLLAFVLSSFPAFIGGVLLAWLLRRQPLMASNSNPGKGHPGVLVGASVGIVLKALVLIPGDMVARTAHGGVGYNLSESLQTDLFYALQFIVIATIAGMWTEHQLRKHLENARSKNTA